MANSGYAGQCAAPRAESICRFGDVSVAIGGATDITTDTRRPLLGCLLRRAFHCVRLGIDFFHRRAGIVSQPVARIAMKKVFEGRARLFGIAEIVLINLADGEERVEAVFAAGIFLAQEAVLFDGAAQDLVIVKAAAHLDHEFGGRDHARVRLRRGGRAKVNTAIRVDHTLVFAASTLSSGTAIERLPHAFRLAELLTSPIIVVMDASPCGRQRQDRQKERHAEAKGAAASS